MRVLGFCIALTLAACSRADSPNQTLRQVEQAFRTSDRLTFEANVDVDRVAASFVDEAKQSGKLGDLDDCLPTDGNCLNTLMNEYVGQTKKYLLNTVGGTNDDQSSRSEFFNNVTVLTSPARVVGNTAAAQIVLARKEKRGYGDSVEIVTRLERSSRGEPWRIVAIENGLALEEFIEQFQRSR